MLQPSTEKSLSHFVDGIQLPAVFSAESLQSAQNYKPREDDVFIVTYPKCGTTWTQAILMLIYTQGCQKESQIKLFTASPFLELKGAEAAESMSRPGAIKTHLPFHRAPWSDKSKYIFVARNPKDCCVSYYHHYKGHGYPESFDEFFELFIGGRVNFGDYFDHLLSWYAHRNKPNVLFLTYEEMKEDPEGNILKMASFIDEEKYAEPLQKDREKLDSVVKYSSFDHMKEIICRDPEEMLPKSEEDEIKPGHPAAEKYPIHNKMPHSKHNPDLLVRKGITGDWRNYFDEEQSKRMDEKFSERTKDFDTVDFWKTYM